MAVADIAVTLRILTSAGVLVLDATTAAGYEVGSLDVLERRWRRSVVTADDVEGDVEQQSVLEATSVGLTVVVTGSTTTQCATRLASLLAAVEARRYRLEIGIDGALETWDANRADASITREWIDAHHAMRRVTLRVPVQPRALVV